MTGPSGADYDAIVIGAGLGGLSAGACLARGGKRVLLVERQAGVGGNAHAFTRGPYTFDPAIHVTAHGYNIEFFDFYFDALGVRDKIELIPAQTLMSVDICGDSFRFPIGTQPLVDALEDYFPGSGAGEFIRVAAAATTESQQPPPRVALRDLEEAMKALPTLFKYRTATVQDVLDEHVSDERAAAVCAGQWPYMGLPPSRLSFMAYAGALMASCDPGPQYVRGSFQRLADTIAGAITDSGGEILTETEVTRILVEDGKVVGVELGGEQVEGVDRDLQRGRAVDVRAAGGGRAPDGAVPDAAAADDAVDLGLPALLGREDRSCAARDRPRDDGVPALGSRRDLE